MFRGIIVAVNILNKNSEMQHVLASKKISVHMLWAEFILHARFTKLIHPIFNTTGTISRTFPSSPLKMSQNTVLDEMSQWFWFTNQKQD